MRENKGTDGRGEGTERKELSQGGTVCVQWEGKLYSVRLYILLQSK